MAWAVEMRLQGTDMSCRNGIAIGLVEEPQFDVDVEAWRLSVFVYWYNRASPRES